MQTRRALVHASGECVCVIAIDACTSVTVVMRFGGDRPCGTAYCVYPITQLGYIHNSATMPASCMHSVCRPQWPRRKCRTPDWTSVHMRL